MPLKDAEGRTRATLVIALLPSSRQHIDLPPLLDLSNKPDRDLSLEPIQLLESEEYRYSVMDVPGRLTTDKPEIFTHDSIKGDTGRIKTRLYTGAVAVTFYDDGEVLGRASFEIRSRKVDYITQYRWMINQLAEDISEVILQKFAAASARLDVDPAGDARTLYQRFAFLQATLLGEPFQAAIHQILSRPYEAWQEVVESRLPNRGLKGDGQLSRALAAAGPRIPWPGGTLSSLPRMIRQQRSISTLDNTPNRFLKFALTRWRDVVQRLGDALARQATSEVRDRGIREVGIVLDSLDSLMSEELFREVGDLTHFPTGNQVLQKKEGYRDVFRIYAQFEVASRLSWKGGEDVYGAGQKDVATLYEYWTFLQLGKVLSQCCQEPFDFGALVVPTSEGAELDLKQGQTTALSGTTKRLGRNLKVTLYFNRTFRRGDDTSWTRPMRPDCSVLIEADPGVLAYYEPIWIHFDAKYRINYLDELFGTARMEDEIAELDSVEAAERKGEAKRDDLLKMHAYRDAVRRSAGAYVLYPGTSEEHRERFKQYHEVLPGLGAFILTPTDGGEARGREGLRAFLEAILNHTALAASQHERARFWAQNVELGPRAPKGEGQALFLAKPPADTRVLIGYTKSRAHLDWIRENGLYNLRGDGRRGSIESQMLSAEYLLLWGEPLGDRTLMFTIDSSLELLNREQLFALGYPAPAGHLYYVLQVSELFERETPNADVIRAVKAKLSPQQPLAAPLAATWLDIVS